MTKSARATALEEGNGSREAILRAALQAFAEKGFDGATTREIANRAGVNHGLIPYYFGGKLKLWQSAVDRAFGEISASMEALMQDRELDDPRTRVRLLLRKSVRYVADHPEFVRLMHEEGKRKGPRMRWLVDRHVKPLFETVSSITRDAQKRGVFPPGIPPIHFHYIMVGAVSFIFHQAEECGRLSGLDPFDESVVADHTGAVEYFLLGPADEEPRP